MRERVFAACERVVLVPRNPIAMALRVATAAVGPLPMQTALYASARMRRTLSGLCSSTRYDIAHIQLARMGTFVPPHVPCVLDFIDALSLNMAQRARFDSGPLGLLARTEARRMAAYERELCNRISRGTVTTPRDREALGSPANVSLVQNGVDLDEFPYVANTRSGAMIAFVGNLGYFPNVDAAAWFAAQMKQVRASCPDAQLHLIGARPAARLVRLAARTEGMQVIGPVARMHAPLAQASVAVAPMRAGTGQQIKILEAMAAGTPVVATSGPASAIGALDGRDLLVADRAEDFAAAVIRLLRDRELASRLAQNARALVERHYSWEASAQALEKAWLLATATAPV